MFTIVAIVVAGLLSTVEDRAVFSDSIEVNRESNAGKIYTQTVKATYVDLNGDGVATVFNLRSKDPAASLLFVAGEMPLEWEILRDRLGEANPGIGIDRRRDDIRQVRPKSLDGMLSYQPVREHDNKETYSRVMRQFGRPALKKAEREALVLLRNYNREQRGKGRSR